MKLGRLLRIVLVGFFAVLTSQGTTMVFDKHLAIEGETGITMKNPSLHSATMEWRSGGDINVSVARNTRKLDHQHTYKNRLGTRDKADGFHAMTPAPLDISGDVRVSCNRLNMENPVFKNKRKTLSFPSFLREQERLALTREEGLALTREERLALTKEGGLALTMEKGALHTTQVRSYRSSYARKKWMPSRELRIASSVAMAALTAVAAPAQRHCAVRAATQLWQRALADALRSALRATASVTWVAHWEVGKARRRRESSTASHNRASLYRSIRPKSKRVH